VFRLDDLGDDAISHLQQYFAQAEKARPAYALHFATVSRERMFIQQEFLYLVTALEVRDRVMVGGVYLEESSFDNVLQTLRSAIPPDVDARFQDVVRGRLAYLNEHTLRDRLKRTLEAAQDALSFMISDPASLLSRIADARNYLTHYSPRVASAGGHGALFSLIPQLRALAEVTILLDMGLSHEEVKGIIKKGNHFGNYAWRARHSAEQF
jgi:hypothetical protein